VTNEIYVDAVSGTTVITYAMYVWSLLSNTVNCTFSGLTLPITNTHPYTALLNIGAAGCSNIKLRNIGTYASPLTLGSANACGLIYILAASAAASNIKIQRIYCSNTRTGIMTGDNSSTSVLQENVYGDYADAADVGAALNYSRKGIGGTLALTAQTAIYGTHWFDCYTSTTAGRLGFVCNETTSLTSAQVSLSGGAAFTSAGGLYMPVIGQISIFETPNYIIGITAFQNSAGTMAGGTIGNYTIEYQIDKNDGNGYGGSWTTASGANLSGITGISAILGFKLKIRITTGTTNTTAITSLYFLTSSTTTTQAYQYPLDPVTVKITTKDAETSAVVSGARVYIEAAAGGDLSIGTVIMNTTTDGSGIARDTGFAFTNNQPITGRTRRGTSAPFYKTAPISGTITSLGLDVTAFMVKDE
jgi:hypothetical protein